MIHEFHTTIIVVLMIIPCGCEDENGIWISESCIDYETQIRWAVNRLNEIEEQEMVFIQGIKKSHPLSRQERLNDDIDFFYCMEKDEYDESKYGLAYLGHGDICLYHLEEQIANGWLPCAVLHELGHRYLSLVDNKNPETIMYEIIVSDCHIKYVWE